MSAPSLPFDHNPSSMRQRLRIGGIALIAVAVSAYMGLYQWGVIDSVWDPVFGSGTATVLTSHTSDLMRRGLGIPDAVFGAWAYSTEAFLALAGSTHRWQYRPWLVLLFGLDVIPMGVVSATLVVLQGVAVGAWCFWCLVTAAISLLLAFLSWDEVWASFVYLRTVWRRDHDARGLWEVFWGRPTGSARTVAAELGS